MVMVNFSGALMPTRRTTRPSTDRPYPARRVRTPRKNAKAIKLRSAVYDRSRRHSHADPNQEAVRPEETGSVLIDRQPSRASRTATGRFYKHRRRPHRHARQQRRGRPLPAAGRPSRPSPKRTRRPERRDHGHHRRGRLRAGRDLGSDTESSGLVTTGRSHRGEPATATWEKPPNTLR